MSGVRAAAAGVVAGATHRWRRRLTRRAREATDVFAGRRLMVLAPHADDETFGCGALIARARAGGDPVTVVVATDGARSTTSERLTAADLAGIRRAELRTACRRLGVDDVVELGLPDGSLGDRTAELIRAVAALHRDRRPQVVLAPCLQDQHGDHQALHRAAVAACGGADLLGYPVWAWHAAPFFATAGAAERPALWAWAARQTGSRRWLRVPTGEFLERKRQAVAAYASQTANLTGEPGWSYLQPDFVAAFLGTDELFLASAPSHSARPGPRRDPVRPAPEIHPEIRCETHKAHRALRRPGGR